VAWIRLPKPPLPSRKSVRNSIGACTSDGRTTKSMYIERVINANSARDVMRLRLRGWPIVINADNIAGTNDRVDRDRDRR